MVSRIQVVLALSLILVVASTGLSLYGKGSGSSSFDTLSGLTTEELARVAEQAVCSGDQDRANEAFLLLKNRYDSDLPLAEQRLFANSFRIQGEALYEQGAYSMAMEALLRSRRIAETQGWRNIEAQALADIGNLYASNYDYETATTFYRLALRMVEPLPADSLKNLKASVLNNLTGTYAIRGLVDSARIFCRRFEMLGDVPERRQAYDLHLTKALVEDAANNRKVARRYYRNAISAADSLELPPIYAAAVYSCLATSYEATGELDTAINFMHIAADVAYDEGYMNEHIESLRDLSRLYESKGLRPMALKYKQRYLELADSVRFSEERDKLHSSEMLYALDSNASTIQGLNAIRTLQWRWLIALASLLAIVVVLLIVVLRQKRALSRAWNNLYDRNHHQIEEQEVERSRRHQDLLPAKAPSTVPEQRTLAIKDELKEALAAKIKLTMEGTDKFCDPDFSIDKLAEIVGSNTRYVSEAINDVIGVSFRTMLNDFRIRRAMRMLDDPENYGHLTIKAIGESVGYRSSSTFITLFTRHTGLKPSIYARLAREKVS